MRDSLISRYVKLFIESSMATKRGFESSLPLFDVKDDVPHEFFGSKMVDGSGNPIVFYHGTRRDFDQFNKEFTDTSGTSISTNYIGFYFTTSPDVALIYTSKGFDPKKGLAVGARTEKAFLNVKKPYYITEKTYWKWGRGSQGEMEDMVTRLKSQGYDGIVMPAVWRGRGKGAFDVVVFDSSQIHKLE